MGTLTNHYRRRRIRNTMLSHIWAGLITGTLILLFLYGCHLLVELVRELPVSDTPTTPQRTESLPVGPEALPGLKSPPRPDYPADSPDRGEDLADTTPTSPHWTRITIHHTVTPTTDPAARVLSIAADHRRRGWDGIGYHFLIAEDGRFWHGRPLSKQGAHVLGENEENIGISFIGTYSKQPPPEAALNTCRVLLRNLQRHYHIPNSRIYFHSELKPTKCPGSWDKSILFQKEGK